MDSLAEYSVPYRCAKSELAVAHAAVGCKTMASIQIGDNVWAAGSLVCLGFRGSLDIPSRLYCGIMAYRAATDADAKAPKMAAGTGLPGAAAREEI